MLFSSLTFIFIFLPFVLLFYYLSDDKYKNAILFIFSLIFYSWGEPKYVIIMLISIIFNYFIAIIIDKISNRKTRKIVFIFSIFVNVFVLFVFKYLDFFISNTNLLFKTHIPLRNIALPIGISFYTFQILSYIIDVYNKKVKVQKNFIYLGMYISFFPQLIAGPIVRYTDIVKQLKKRKMTLDNFSNGFRRFLIGFSKKIIIANNVAIIADLVFNGYENNNYGAIILLVGILAYTLQIYYDFSGYSDMAIGLGKIFGFDFLENFNYPYVATSITDFWRRWHISLSMWFRDYVYIPLGGNRCKKIRWIFNMFIVWMLTGLWHGANWNFILWGLFYFFILLIEKIYLKNILNKIPKIICWIYSFIIINIGWLIFRVESISKILDISKRIITFKDSNIMEFVTSNYYLLHSSIYIIIGFIFMFPITRLFEKYNNEEWYKYARDVILIILFMFGILSLINNSYNPFIYFRF